MGRKIAVVTGATGGFGKEFVKLIQKKAEIEEIWCLARDKEKLEAQEGEEPGRIRGFSVDTGKTESVAAFGRELERETPDVRYLINAAGYAKFCDYADLNVTESVDMIAVNAGGAVAVGLVCLPYMGEGSRIVNISSSSSFQPLPYLNLYAATKAFVLRYTRALNVELLSRKITATAVTPGWMLTGLYERAAIGAKKGARRFPFMTTPDKVAAKALRDAERGKAQSVYGVSAKAQRLIAKLLPSSCMMKIWLLQQGISPEGDRLGD